MNRKPPTAPDGSGFRYSKGGSSVFKVLRSKNAGPYTLTFDIVLTDREALPRLKRVLNRRDLASAFQVREEDVLGVYFHEAMGAAKVSIRRKTPSGHPGDSDCYGMNQEAPLKRLILARLKG